MPINNVVLITTFLAAVPDAPLNYLPIAALIADNGVAPFAEKAKIYSSTTEMIDDGFLLTDDVVLAAAQIFGQTAFTATPPTRVVVVNAAAYVAQVSEFQVEASADGTYELFISLIGGSPVLAASFAAVTNTPTEIKDGLIAAFNVGPFAADYVAASVDLDSGSITANNAGAPFLLTGSGPGGAADITITTPTPNVGPAEDLDAAFVVEPFWCVIPDPAMNDLIQYEVSRWAEDSAQTTSTRRNVCILQTDDADIQNATEPNFSSVLVLLNRTRTFPLRHANEVDKMSAAWFGRYGGQFPGTFAWHFGELSGTTETTDILYSLTEGDNFAAQNTAWVERDGPAAAAALRIYATGPGAGGFFIVQKQAEDYWWLQMRAAMVAFVAGGSNLDAAGIQAAVAEVNVVNQQLGQGDNPVLDLDRTTVTAVDLSSVPLAEQAVGDYQTTGGINVTTVLIPKLRELRVSGTFLLA